MNCAEAHSRHCRVKNVAGHTMVRALVDPGRPGGPRSATAFDHRAHSRRRRGRCHHRHVPAMLAVDAHPDSSVEIRPQVDCGERRALRHNVGDKGGWFVGKSASRREDDTWLGQWPRDRRIRNDSTGECRVPTSMSPGEADAPGLDGIRTVAVGSPGSRNAHQATRSNNCSCGEPLRAFCRQRLTE
jgi:hypothetical protein